MLTKGKKFIKVAEDFICEVCGAKVEGAGYTDHCPKCLWSKHVDLDPGDRAAECGGLMEPVGAEQKRGEWRILYRCQKCGQKKFNRVDPKDSKENLVKISASGGLPR